MSTAAPAIRLLSELPPGPPGFPLLGHLPRLQRDLLAFLVECSQNYGDIVPLQFGPQRVLLLTHPDSVETMLVTRHRSFMKGRFYRLLEPMLGQGLFTSDGSFWLRQRRLAAPAFHRERIEGYAQIMVDYAGQLVASWTDGAQRDVYEDMMGLTLRIVGKAMFDADIARDAPELGVAVGVALTQLNNEIYGLPLLIPQGWPTPGRRRLRRAVDRLDAIVFNIIAERRKNPSQHSDLLTTLMEARDEDGSQMSDRQLRDEAATLIMAGHETSALALAWAWYLLATHPDIEARLHAEVDTVLNGRMPELADLPRLAYCEMIIREALRLYPPAVEFGRETLEPCDVGGYRLPPGTVVFTSPWIIQRDARWFDDPNRFWPERWADGLAQRIPRFAFLPFGGGPRVCMGQPFAWMETVLVLATIAQRYRLSLAPGARVEPLPALTLRLKHGLPMHVQRR